MLKTARVEILFDLLMVMDLKRPLTQICEPNDISGLELMELGLVPIDHGAKPTHIEQRPTSSIPEDSTVNAANCPIRNENVRTRVTSNGIDAVRSKRD